MHKKKVRKNTLAKDVWRRLKRNKLAMFSIFILIFLVFISFFGSMLAPYDYATQDIEAIKQFPNSTHWFGTDNFGRDIFSRILVGTKYTMIIAFCCTGLSALSGVILGSIAAVYPRFDNIIMRSIDIVMGIPSFMMALSIIMALGASMANMIIALSITSMPAFARVTRAQILNVKDQEYIEASVSIGASDIRILVRHILPNAFAPILVQFTICAVNVILWSAALSFIGQGVAPPTPEWGLMVSNGRIFLRDYPYMSIIPGFAIIITTYALNIFGDGLRDALDPRLKQ